MDKSRLHPVIKHMLIIFEQFFQFLVDLAGYLTEKLFDVFALSFVVLGVMFVAPTALNPDARAAFLARFLVQTCQVTKDCNFDHLLTGLAVALVIMIGLVIFTFREMSENNPILQITEGHNTAKDKIERINQAMEEMGLKELNELNEYIDKLIEKRGE